MTLSKTTLRWFIGIAGLAILALMVYSIDRTAWVFGLFEGDRAYAHEFGLAAAIVIELAGIAFIIAEATAVKQIRFWVVLGLAAILIVQTLANLIAGALRGFDTIASALPTNGWATAWALALWAFANALIPALIFILSKIEAYLVRYYLTVPATVVVTQPVARAAQIAAPAVAALSQPVAEPAQDVAPVSQMAAETMQGTPAATPARLTLRHLTVHPTGPAHDAPAFAVPATQYDDYMTIADALVTGRASLRTVATELGMSDASARRRRDELVKAGVLTRDGDAYQKNGVALVKGE